MNELQKESIDKKFQKELNAGIVALVLLAILNKTGGSMYGYQIARLVEDSETGGASIKLGTLYPVLRSLEESGLLASEVEPSVTGPPRRYYRITDEGRQTLGRWRLFWQQPQEMVETHLKGVEDD